MAIAPQVGGLKATYLRLNQWDSFHYMDIVNRGYQLPLGSLVANDVHSNRANVAYFPAYPLLCQLVQKVFKFSTPIALLVTSQFFCFLFWSELFLLFSVLGYPMQRAMRVALLLLIYPASFYLVAGYSESLFLASLLGLILGTEIWIKCSKFEPLIFIATSLSGFLLSSSRLVGIPLVFYPFLRLFFYHQNFFSWKKWLDSGFLILLSSLGAALFFLGCKFQFGNWSTYFQLQRLGWGNEPNYFAFFNPSSYLPRFFFEDTVTSVCRVTNLVMLILFGMSLKAVLMRESKSGALYLSAFSLFFISLSAKANYNMDSMVRYNLPVFCLLVVVLCILEIGTRFFSIKRSHMIFGYLFMIALQLWLIRIFTKGGWVA